MKFVENRGDIRKLPGKKHMENFGSLGHKKVHKYLAGFCSAIFSRTTYILGFYTNRAAPNSQQHDWGLVKAMKPLAESNAGRPYYF